MDDNLVMSTYLDESLSNNINFLRGEEDNIDTINKSLEISMLNIDSGKMGTLGNIAESSEAVQISNVNVKKEILEDPYIEVEIREKKKKELEPFIIIEDLAVKSTVVTELKDEAVDIKQEITVKNEIGSSGKNTKDRIEEENQLEFFCDSCRKPFSSSSGFRKHMKTHKEEKTYQCMQCDKSFRQSNHLKMHERIHTSQCSFHCEMCLETFRYKSALSSHMKKHFGVKDHSCEVCSASFHSKHELKIHMIKHAGELPYKCKECGDEFAIARRLKRHMMIHTGERPFQCEVCGVVFREQFTLNVHMGIHLPRGPYPCDICGEEFSRLNSLTLHRRVHNTDNTYSYVPKKCDQRKDGATSVECKSPARSIFTDDSVLDEPIFESNYPTSDEMTSENKVQGCSNIETNLNSDQELQSCLSDAMVQAKISLEKGLPEEGVTSVPHPNVVREALSTGTLLESQADDGKGYLIVLPKALVERNYTLFTVGPPAVTPKIPETVEQVILKENDEVLQNNCNLFVYDNSLDSITEVAFQSNQEIVSEEPQSKPKRQKKRKEPLSDDDNDAIQSELQPKKTEKSPIKKKQKKKTKPLVSKLYRCQQCGKDYKTSSNLNIHMRTHTGERPYYCDYCGLGFKQLAHLQSHVRIHTGETPYQCNLCEQAFNQSSRLKYHIRSVHIKGKLKKPKMDKQCFVRNFYCKICDYTFLNSCFKTDHMKTHADETRYKCEKCDAYFKGKSSLKKHQSCHADDKWGICEVCGLPYKDLDALNLHKKESHGITEDTEEMANIQSDIKFGMGDDNQVSCEILQHTDVQYPSHAEKDLEHSRLPDFSSGLNVAEIKETNSEIKVLEDGKYQCCMCNKIFNTRSNARVHVRLHNDNRPYKCNDCGRAFRQISHLKDHVKMHTGEKPFKCSVCPATFAQSSGVKVHIRKYHKGKAYVINEQKDKDNLKQDSIVFENAPQTRDDTVIINIENGQSVSVEHKQCLNEQECNVDIEEQCNICGKSFLTQYMKYHMRTHKKLSYKCVVCKKFHKKYELSSHKRDKKEEKHYVCSKCKCSEKFPFDGVSDISNVKSVHQSDGRKNQELETEKCTEPLNCKDKLDIVESFENYEECVNEYEKQARNVCDICSKTFKRKSALKFHKQLSHKDDSDVTDKKNKKINKFFSKKIATIPEGLGTNSTVNDKLIYDSTIVNSFRERHNKDDCFICNFCGYDIQSLPELREHIKNQHSCQEEHIAVFKENVELVSCSVDRKQNITITDNFHASTEKVKKLCLGQKEHATTIRETAGIGSINNKSKNVNSKKNLNNSATSPIQLFTNVENSYECVKCKKSFSRASKLKDHINRWCQAK